MEPRSLSISVVIPAYNREKLILPTLESVCSQTLKPVEVLVIDDKSTDATVGTVAAYAANFPSLPIRCIEQDKNQGVSAARNRGIREAQGTWVAFLDSDDMWEPAHLAGLASAQDGGHGDVIFSRVRGFSDEDPSASEKTWTSRFATTEEVLREMIHACHILPSAAMARRDLLITNGLFDETPTIQHAEDWDLWLRLIEKDVKFQMHDAYTCRYRQHENSACRNKTRLYRAVLHCLHKHPNFPLTSKEQWHSSIYYFQTKLARSLFETGDQKASDAFRMAWAAKGGGGLALIAAMLCHATLWVPPTRRFTQAFLRRYF